MALARTRPLSRCMSFTLARNFATKRAMPALTCKVNPLDIKINNSFTVWNSHKILVRGKHSIFQPDIPDLEELRERVLKACNTHEKLSKQKLTLESHFYKDLGLDSLDQIEIIMAVEDEFSYEIPDEDSERLVTPADIVQYIADKENIFE